MESTKIVLLGQFGVGKSSLMRRFLEDKFEHNYMPTLGVQIKKKVIELPSGRQLNMIIWDLEGFSTVSKIRTSYLLGAHGFIFIFDLTRPVTYKNLTEELLFISTKYPQVDLVVVGNKADLQDPKLIQDFLTPLGIAVDHFVSAKTGAQVGQIFSGISQKINTYD